MIRVLKYTLHERGIAIQPLPRGARVLSVNDQAGAVQLWAQVDDTLALERREFAVLFTGFDEVPYRGVFIGTVLSHGGNIVRHIFEIKEES